MAKHDKKPADVRVDSEDMERTDTILEPPINPKLLEMIPRNDLRELWCIERLSLAKIEERFGLDKGQARELANHYKLNQNSGAVEAMAEKRAKIKELEEQLVAFEGIDINKYNSTLEEIELLRVEIQAARDKNGELEGRLTEETTRSEGLQIKYDELHDFTYGGRDESGVYHEGVVERLGKHENIANLREAATGQRDPLVESSVGQDAEQWEVPKPEDKEGENSVEQLEKAASEGNQDSIFDDPEEPGLALDSEVDKSRYPTPVHVTVDNGNNPGWGWKAWGAVTAGLSATAIVGILGLKLLEYRKDIHGTDDGYLAQITALEERNENLVKKLKIAGDREDELEDTVGGLRRAALRDKKANTKALADQKADYDTKENILNKAIDNHLLSIGSLQRQLEDAKTQYGEQSKEYGAAKEAHAKAITAYEQTLGTLRDNPHGLDWIGKRFIMNSAKAVRVYNETMEIVPGSEGYEAPELPEVEEPANSIGIKISPEGKGPKKSGK